MNGFLNIECKNWMDFIEWLKHWMNFLISWMFFLLAWCYTDNVNLIKFMTTSQTKKENHALCNALNHLESMVENYEIGSYIEQSNVTTQDQEEKLE